MASAIYIYSRRVTSTNRDKQNYTNRKELKGSFKTKTEDLNRAKS